MPVESQPPAPQGVEKITVRFGNRDVVLTYQSGVDHYCADIPMWLERRDDGCLAWVEFGSDEVSAECRTPQLAADAVEAKLRRLHNDTGRLLGAVPGGEGERLAKQHAFAERFRPQIAEVAGCGPDSHWGDIATVLGAKVRRLESDLSRLRAAPSDPVAQADIDYIIRWIVQIDGTLMRDTLPKNIRELARRVHERGAAPSEGSGELQRLTARVAEGVLREARRTPIQAHGCEEVCSLESQLAAQERELAELRGRLEHLTELINCPHNDDWFYGVRIEAAHQQERWGAEHDDGKEPQDWFWLIGYLGGKALRAAIDGNPDKAKHHTISTAAVLLNWHRRISGQPGDMRPGIKSPNQRVDELNEVADRLEAALQPQERADEEA